MSRDNSTPVQRPEAVALPIKRTLEDKMLKFIEGHNPQIWAVIALLAVVVVLQR